jgi:hypothetical protein
MHWLSLKIQVIEKGRRAQVRFATSIFELWSIAAMNKTSGQAEFITKYFCKNQPQGKVSAEMSMLCPI